MIQFSKTNNFCFVDLDSISVNKKGFVKNILKHYKSTNHYYNSLIYFIMLVYKIKKII